MPGLGGPLLSLRKCKKLIWQGFPRATARASRCSCKAWSWRRLWTSSSALAPFCRAHAVCFRSESF